MVRCFPYKMLVIVTITLLTFTACSPAPNQLTPTRQAPSITQPVVEETPTPTETLPASATPSPSTTPTQSATTTSSPTPSATLDTGVPAFAHIIVIVLENREFGIVIGNPQMPLFNDWAKQYTLLSEHYAIRHPSLPNYLAMIGGETFGVTSNCSNCYIDAPSLPDLIEASGRSWKAYMEDMPEPCFPGDTATYVQKHNPFMYFDPIRLNAERCQRSVVPYTELNVDLANKTLPDFVFITPNQCNNAHDCDLKTADLWLGSQVPYLLAFPGIAQNGLIILTWDEGQGDHGCCGYEPGGGRIATILISPRVQRGFIDSTPYTHYSLLKTISAAWRLPYLGEAAKEENALILAPWTTSVP